MKQNWKKMAIQGVIIIAVVVGLVLLANVLVNNFNIVEFIKAFHGG